jgi:hypothetical protein
LYGTSSDETTNTSSVSSCDATVIKPNESLDNDTLNDDIREGPGQMAKPFKNQGADHGLDDSLGLRPKLWSNFMLPFNARPVSTRKFSAKPTAAPSSKFKGIETVLNTLDLNVKWRNQNGNYQVLFSRSSPLESDSNASTAI